MLRGFAALLREWREHSQFTQTQREKQDADRVEVVHLVYRAARLTKNRLDTVGCSPVDSELADAWSKAARAATKVAPVLARRCRLKEIGWGHGWHHDWVDQQNTEDLDLDVDHVLLAAQALLPESSRVELEDEMGQIESGIRHRPRLL